jgi:hypothetical protein
MSLSPAVAETPRQALGTVVVVPVTPLHADGNPDWDACAALTRRLIDGGITVITPNGNTGEFYALSQAEARQALETAARASKGQAELLAGVGHDIGPVTVTVGLQSGFVPERGVKALLDCFVFRNRQGLQMLSGACWTSRMTRPCGNCSAPRRCRPGSSPVAGTTRATAPPWPALVKQGLVVHGQPRPRPSS